ncbi:MAG: FAD-binding oxidoreductase [Candidatus Thorarchaeota archaeon]|jgi:FAD/FMN-containing dehydrogenase
MNATELISDLADVSWVSDLMVERLSASGDTTGIPYYHYRWKKKWLADYVAWPTTSEEVSAIQKYAVKHRVPIIPRGGGTCYYGSASPTRGGIVIDTKRMDNIIEVNKNALYVHVGAGAVWEILDNELAKQGFNLPVAPQSRVASTLAGWLAIGGKAGIGTPKYGSMIDNVLEMEVVRPDGTIETVTGDEMELFFGTSGIIGVVTSMKLKIIPSPESTEGLMFAFQDLEKALDALIRLSNTKIQPIYLRVTDLEYEWRIQGGLPPDTTGQFFVVVTYRGTVDEVTESLKTARGIFEVASGTEMPHSYYQMNWDERDIVEMKLKLEVPTLSMQNFWVPLSSIEPLVRKMYKIARSYKINSCFYLVQGSSAMARLCVFAPSDHRHWMHFMSGKAMLHRLVKMMYRQGGELYTLGLQNTVYIKKYQPQDYKQFRELRKKWDPKGIMNPDKLTNCIMSYTRMNLMFTMNGNFRRMQVFLRRGKNILPIPTAYQEGHV